MVNRIRFFFFTEIFLNVIFFITKRKRNVISNLWSINIKDRMQKIVKFKNTFQQ